MLELPSSRAAYEPLREVVDGRPLRSVKYPFGVSGNPGSIDGVLEDGRESQQISAYLSKEELMELYNARGHMPPIQLRPPAANALEEATRRVEQLDDDLREHLQEICDRIGSLESTHPSCFERSWTTLRKYARLGIIKELLPQLAFFVVYSFCVTYYVSLQDDWDLRWSATRQDAIYYPAVVLSFLLCFRASGCMDRYKEGLRTSFEMEKALREASFEVMTSLSLDEEGLDSLEAQMRSIKKRYFKHEFRRLVGLLFACASRDLNDSAVDGGEVNEFEASKIPFSMTKVEQAAVLVTHSALGHAFRVYLVASWVLKLLKGIHKESLFENDDVYRKTEEKLENFKSAWLDARQVAYSAMPGSVSHILWLLTTIMSLFMPWEWVSVCQWSTWFPSTLLTISFYGIMEIANSMENPFGFDDDDIQIWEVAQHLDEEICLTMHYALLDEFGGENLYRSLLGTDMIFLDEAD